MKATSYPFLRESSQAMGSQGGELRYTLRNAARNRTSRAGACARSGSGARRVSRSCWTCRRCRIGVHDFEVTPVWRVCAGPYRGVARS